MAVLVWASWSDLTKREIPNAAAVLLGLTAVADAWAGGVLALLYLCLNLVRTRRTTEIPYGVAVSLSLLLMLTHMV